MLATHRGRRCGLQVCWLKSSIRSAVVFLSIVGVLSAGGGGAWTEVHSSMIVCPPADRATVKAAMPATVASVRNIEPWRIDIVVSRRSEERRVGKECRGLGQ